VRWGRSEKVFETKLVLRRLPFDPFLLKGFYEKGKERPMCCHRLFSVDLLTRNADSLTEGRVTLLWIREKAIFIHKLLQRRADFARKIGYIA
jgi:hypothetical protein